MLRLAGTEGLRCPKKALGGSRGWGRGGGQGFLPRPYKDLGRCEKTPSTLNVARGKRSGQDGRTTGLNRGGGGCRGGVLILSKMLVPAKLFGEKKDRNGAALGEPKPGGSGSKRKRKR